jgi:Holliday junction resolvase RusA-like endonuclease
MTFLGASPLSGILEFELNLAPVSLQARSEAKAAFRTAIQNITQTAAFLLAGDIHLSVEWFISEQARYETDRSPDVDNILKPLIDSLVGPKGILIDDNQIQNLSCSWVDWHQSSEQVHIALRFSPDEWLPKDGLVFAQFKNGLCMPIPEVSIGERLGWLEAYSIVLATRGDADKKGIPYKWARIIMPSQRVFHRTRIHDFPVYLESDLRAMYQLED